MERNFGKYITTDISKREYNVNIKPSPNEKYLRIADEIVAEELEKIKTEYEIDMWTLNVIYYTTEVSVLEKEGRLREIKRNVKANERPGWQIRLESRIGALRRKISHTYVLIECNRTKAYSKHQKEIKRKFEKQYGKATINNLNATITKLKQNLTVESEKLKRRKSIRERKYVNRIFKVSPKKIYREMRDGSKIKVSQMPEQSKVEDFWSSVWSIPLQHNTEAHWLNEIREYCKDVNPKPM